MFHSLTKDFRQLPQLVAVAEEGAKHGTATMADVAKLNRNKDRNCRELRCSGRHACLVRIIARKPPSIACPFRMSLSEAQAAGLFSLEDGRNGPNIPDFR